METWAIPLGALIVSLATLIFTGMMMRQKAEVAQVASVEARIQRAEDDLRRAADELRECRIDRERYLNDLKSLREENLELMKKAVWANGGTT